MKSPIRSTRFRRSISAAIGVVLTSTAVSACALLAPGGLKTITTDADTFSASNHVAEQRGNDTRLRVMDSRGKLKIAYVSFPVAGAAGPVSASVRIVPLQSKFALSVREVGAFTEATTHATRPALGKEVGRLAATKAGEQQSIAVQGVTVTQGRINLAITTTSPYELEIVSAEGARDGADAPTLFIASEQLGEDTITTPTIDDTPDPVDPPVADPDPQGWNLTFSDEFNGTSVDTSKWNIYDEAGTYNSVESPKASTCPKAGNVSVGSGKLVMKVAPANGACRGGQAQTGAGMNTWGKFQQAQGRWEARARWTDAGNNLWGGFWTHGNGGPGYNKSKASEVDIFEYIGKTAEPNISRFKPAIHYDYACTDPCGMQNVVHSPYDVTAWHTYTLEWDEAVPGNASTTQLRFYLDGVQIAQFDKQGAWRVNANGSKTLITGGSWINDNAAFPYPFDAAREHRIILSAWAGAPGLDPASTTRGFNPAGGSAALEVDWVRVYSH